MSATECVAQEWGHGVAAVMRLDNGQNVTLGTVIARAGEGTIYEITGHPEWAAKIFHPDLKDLAAKRAKVTAMAGSQPTGAVQSDGFTVLTWPLHTLTGNDGTSGYLMSRIDTTNAVEIHALSNPADRNNPLPSAPQWTPHATWQHLTNVAANLCLAVETVHSVNAVIGDFQERNILVNDTTRVTLVDVDSIQFTDTAGHQFLCAVGRPEFTAPELAGTNLATTARQKPSDLFALAVHIHLLLMAGNHPFLRGHWTGPGDQPDALTLAKTGQWAGGPRSQLHTHPLAPPVTFLPPDIQRLFVRAFTDGANNPNARPTATEWREALTHIQTTECPRGHQIPAEADPCPWCTIDNERTNRRQQRATAPIGAGRSVPAPRPPSRPAPSSAPPVARPANPSKGTRTGLIAAAVAVAVVAVGGIAYALGSGGSDSSDGRRGGSSQASGTCSGIPDIGSGSASLGTDGLVIDVPLSASCGSDDLMGGSSVLVTVSDGYRDVASGHFNLATNPVRLSGGSAQTQEFVFPAGMYWRTPEMISSGSLDVQITGFSPGGSGGYSSGTDRVLAAAPGSPVHESVDSIAASTLSELSSSDYGYVRSNLADRWNPQISSKRVGLVADGITYGSADILRDHLSLRQRYPDVRLVTSNDWTTFSGSDWWVTIVGSPSSDSAIANGWCDTNGIDSWNCFAKLISDHRGSDGTTVLRK
ncbi:hypothetical protein MFAL_13900 [Mycolicibacterium fallax]|nr:hypothetical protein MFAL_13900 [Mycolicibacterium fallax]